VQTFQATDPLDERGVERQALLVQLLDLIDVLVPRPGHIPARQDCLRQARPPQVDPRRGEDCHHVPEAEVLVLVLEQRVPTRGASARLVKLLIAGGMECQLKELGH